ncbi:MAG: DUF3466 family protein [Phycisphaerae bacterium]|nr:DUF3466 family protein [Phycisphaerae bacterium]
MDDNAKATFPARAKDSATRRLSHGMAIPAILIALWLPAQPRAEAQEYTLIEIGPIGGGTGSAGADLNASGQAIATCNTATSGETRTVFYSNGYRADIGTMGEQMTVGAAINDSAQIVGASVTPPGAVTGFLYAGGVFTNLGSLGGNDTHPRGINSTGQVVGQSLPAVGAYNYHAFLWQAGAMTDLGVLPGGAGSVAGDINDAGQIAGMSAVPGGETHIALWSGGTITDLGTLGGISGMAHAINESGAIVGQSKTAAFFDHAFLWTAAAGLTDLGTFGGNLSAASDINSQGVVVGQADITSGAAHAFIWDATNGMRDLNDLLADPNWTLTSAEAINDSGVVIATGFRGADVRAVLLTPIPAPTPTPTPCCLPYGVPLISFLTIAAWLMCRFAAPIRRS